jgi:plastocyanin
MLEGVTLTTNRTVRTVILSTLLALLTAAFMIGSVSAHTVTPTKGSSAPTRRGVEQVNILSGPRFDPQRVVVDVNDTVRITNRTAHTQRLTFNGKVIATLAPGQSFSRTFKMRGTFVFGLASHPNAKLTVVVNPGHAG